MTLRSNLRVLAMGAAAVALLSVLTVDASAQYIAVAGTFVGAAGDCGPGYPAGNKIVTAAWLNGLGLPDNGTANPGGTVQQGLLLSKNGPTPNCSAAGANITGFASGGTLSALGFDYRLGGHCGGGAPRILVTDASNATYAFGCNTGTASAAPQDPANWTRVTYNAAGAPYPGAETFIFGVTPVKSIEIIFDEGTDTANPPGDPEGVGLATIDNIRINNTFITKKAGNPILP